jgi:maleylpyruvate isomerase
MILHGYFRSSASWRVRIALALKGIAVEQAFYHLRKGDQNTPAYRALNPQGLLPSLVLDDATVLTQSLAIIDYLDEVHPEPPLLPEGAAGRARARAAAMVIACDVHPVQNLKVLARVRALAGEDASQDWARTTIAEGLSAFAALIAEEPGPFCFGNRPSVADICLVPQLGNARRFGATCDQGRIGEVEKACMDHPAFDAARPEAQPDYE